MKRSFLQNYLPLIGFAIVGFGAVALFYMRFSPAVAQNKPTYKVGAPKLSKELETGQAERELEKAKLRREYLVSRRARLLERERDIKKRLREVSERPQVVEKPGPDYFRIPQQDPALALREDLRSVQEQLKEIEDGTYRVPALLGFDKKSK